jgi:two-component system chemotaxis response regulator CheB
LHHQTTGHDVVVIGASAGGVEALLRLVAGLPEDFGGAVFVVLHQLPNRRSALASILGRAGPLPAVQAEHLAPVRTGTIYVAPPNRHLVVHQGHMALEAGPRENHARPAVDVLFRSAARAYGPRVVGVVLSGTLRDGALGLAAIKMRGGITMVQDPAEALFPGMPESALKTTEIDFCLPAAAIPARLVELTHHTLEHQGMQPSESDRPADPETTSHAGDEPGGESSPKLPNTASGLTCPECHGSLWELTEDDRPRYECRIGHAYSVDALLDHQGETVEAALWSAVNALQERAATFRRLADSPSPVTTGRGYEERAEQIERQADALLALLQSLIADGQIG